MAREVQDKCEQINTMFKRYLAAAFDNNEKFERRKGFVAAILCKAWDDKRFTKNHFEKVFKVKDIENFNIGFSLSRKDMFAACKAYYPEFGTASTAR